MEESVIYQDILQKGELKGEKREALKLITRLLNRQLGQLNSFLIERIQELSTQQLEALVDILFNFTTEHDLILWLNKQEELRA